MSLGGSSRMDLANSSQDLESNGVTGSSSNGGTTTGAQMVQGTKRGLFMALTVGVVLLVLVISAAVLVSKSDSTESAAEPNINEKNETVKLEDVLDGRFGSVGLNGTWISGSELQFFIRNGSLAIYNANYDNVTIVIEVDEFLNFLNGRRPFQCVFSADRKFVMVGHNYHKIYRHSFHADYAIYDVDARTFEAIIPPGSENGNEQTQIQLTQWSPVGNAFAFVHENNIFFREAAKTGSVHKITLDGSPIFFNGVTDWVYEEEMFGSYNALWFSPDGDKLAFASFDDRNVSSMEYSFYGEPGVNQYPIILKIPYPKAGLSNPVAKMTICVLPNQGSNSALIPGPPLEHDHYIGTVFWFTNTELGVITLNRNQNESKTYLCTAVPADNCKIVFEQTQNNGWIDVTTPSVSKGGEYLTLLSKRQSSNMHYHHIVKVDLNKTEVPITSGSYAIDQILGWDFEQNKIYYTATRNNGMENIPGDPRESHLYSISDDGVSPGTPECITCLLRNIEGQYCSNNNIQMSKDFTYFTHTCTGPDPTEIRIRNNTKESGYQDIIMWADNQDLRNRIKPIALPQLLHFDIPLKDNFIGKAKLLIPQEFDKDKEYPILVDVYAGPGSQKITNRFLIDWGTSLTTDKKVIYAYIDGRGSGRQSDDLLFAINRKLGTVEIEDQIAGLDWLINHVTEIKIDKNKTAIWGWSYGGYATAMVMGTDTKQVYKCGISVAPVTNWDLYDTIYTERYMGTPLKEDNFDGYNNSAVANHIENFRNKQYLLVHGNADDNVHYQQSMILSRALERADILFRQQSYPDEDHGIPTMRKHLYHTMEKFLFEDCFK